MESTIRIDYNSSPASPVIKIITPKCLNEDSDPKDRLVQDFLLTASVSNKNQIFYLENSFPLESPFNLTLIAPVRYHDEPEKLHNHVERRVLSFDDICECKEFDDKKPVNEVVNMVKAPARYGTYLKIKDFFEWVEAQPYVVKAK